MKIFVSIITLTIAAQCHVSDEQRDKLKDHQKICIDKTRVNPELVEKTKIGEFVEDPDLNEFLFCVILRMDFLNEAGEFQRDIIRAKISVAHETEHADAVVAICTSKTEDTPQLTSFELVKCFYKNSDAYFIV